MLNEDQLSVCIDALIRLGIIETVAGDGREGELLRLKAPPQRLVARILSEARGGPPEGMDLIPWFSISLVKTLLDVKKIQVPRDELAGMAAVVMGFITEGSVMQELRVGYSRPAVSRKLARKGSKLDRTLRPA